MEYNNINCKKGDIFYVAKNPNSSPVGSEQYADRPAIIVSNDTGNLFSPTVEVVYLTSQPKTELPTHVSVLCKVPSTALCESVYTVSKERLQTYIRSITDEEMKAIDDALLLSLGISQKNNVISMPAVENTEIIKLQTERDLYKNMYESLLKQMIPA